MISGGAQTTGWLTIALAGLLLENAVFTRGLGLHKQDATKSISVILWQGGFVTFLTVVSTVIAWPVYRLFREAKIETQLGLRYYYALSSLACVCAVFAVTMLITRSYYPKIYYVLRAYSDHILLNSAILGTILLSFGSGRGFLASLLFSFFSGIGYCVALLILHEGRTRFTISGIPRSFRGLPIMLLYIGLFSLALYGLIGHQLPT